MRYWSTIALVTLVFTLTGCGGATKPPPTLSEEQKQKIAEEDRRVADEESQGSVNKKKTR